MTSWILLNLFITNTVLAEVREIEALFDLSLKELLEIDVSLATGQNQQLLDAPAVISVISAKEIKQWGYLSVAEAIQQLPGIYCINDRLAVSCSLRGLGSGFRSYNKILKVMINDQPISFRSDSSNYLGPELIPISIIERIEFLRGPASALYGANAFLGVINIITKQATQNIQGELRSSISSDSSYISADYEYGNADQGFSLALSRADIDQSGAVVPDTLPSQSLFTPGDSSQSDYQRPVTAFAQYHLVWSDHKTQLNAYWTRQDSKANFVDFGRFSETGELGREVRISVEQGYLQLQDDWQVDENWQIQSSLAYAKGRPSNKENLDVGLVQTTVERDFGFSAIDTSVEALWAVNANHNLMLGLDYSRDEEKLFESVEVDRITGVKLAKGIAQGHKTFLNTGVYLQYSGALTQALQLTLNARLDDHNIYGKDDNYRVAVVYRFSPRLTSKLLYGTSYKAPAAIQLFGQPLFDGEVDGNADLKVESAYTLEAQVQWQFSEKLYASLNVFNMQVDDQVLLALSGANQQPINQGEQRTTGIEAEAWLKDVKQQLKMSLALQRSEVDKLDMLGRTITVPSAAYPEFVANIQYRYRWSKSFDAGVHYFYASARRANDSNIQLNTDLPYQLDDYQLLHISLNYYYQNLTLTVKVNNIFDEEYVEPGYASIDIPGIGRQSFMMMSVTF